MTTLKILGAAAILTSMLASPVMAQRVILDPGKCAQYYPNANCQNYGADNPYTGNYQQQQQYTGSYQQQRAYRHNGRWHDSYNRWDGDRRDSGFWPADAAAGVVGGAVGTAGAIATAPFGGDAYARQNGFVCTPGTWFRGEDGIRHRCR